MNLVSKKQKDRRRRQMRARKKITGTAERPRLAVFRSLRNLSAQVIDDATGTTIASVTTESKAFGKYGGNVEAAKTIGSELAAKVKEKGISELVFDRAGRQYHGRIKAFADAVREGGLKF